MRCPRCGYEWKPRVPNPRECPRCKVRLDYPPKKLRAPAPIPEVKEIKRKEVRKGMSQKLPWVAAAIIIIGVAAVGAWALSTPGPTVTPSAPSAPTPGLPTNTLDSWGANVWGSGVVPSELWSANVYPTQGTISATWNTVVV